jgi:hypothetical protein
VYALLLAVLVLADARPAAAQIVNTDPLFRGDVDQPVAFHLEGHTEIRRGSSELFQLGMQLAARLRQAPSQLMLTAALNRATAADMDIVDNSFAHLRYRYEYAERLFAEAFAQIARDRFRRISQRSLLGAGPRFTVLEAPGFGWDLAAAYMLEFETLSSGPGAPDGLERTAHRLSLSSSITYELSWLIVRNTIFVQPEIRDVDNVRVLHQQDFSLKVTDVLSAKWSYNQYYDSISPPDIAPLDTTLIASIVVDL